MPKKKSRDIEKSYSTGEFVAKLRRLKRLHLWGNKLSEAEKKKIKQMSKADIVF